MSAAVQSVSSNSTAAPPAVKTSRSLRHSLRSVNRELWILLAIFAVAAVVNSLVASHRMVLGFYALPTIYSAYAYGRRHAVMTAVASIFLVVGFSFLNPAMTGNRLQFTGDDRWFDLGVWGGILIITAYAMGTLYEHKEANLRELRDSYEGIMVILQHIASDSKYSQNHPYRVSMFATKIAEQMQLPFSRIEDVRSAALLHEIDKVGISREILYKAAQFSDEEVKQMEQDLRDGKTVAAGKGNSLRRVIPILLAYQAGVERPDPGVPLEARILVVADTYDSLTSAKASRVAPSEAMERIVQRAGIEYDQEVVDAMVTVFRRRGA